MSSYDHSKDSKVVSDYEHKKSWISSVSCPQTPRWWGPVRPGTRCEGLDMQIHCRNPCRIKSHKQLNRKKTKYMKFPLARALTSKCWQMTLALVFGRLPPVLQMWLGSSQTGAMWVGFRVNFRSFRSFWGTELHDMWENAAVSTLHVEQNFTMRQAQHNWHALPNVVKLANLSEGQIYAQKKN